MIGRRRRGPRRRRGGTETAIRVGVAVLTEGHLPDDVADDAAHHAARLVQRMRAAWRRADGGGIQQVVQAPGPAFAQATCREATELHHLADLRDRGEPLTMEQASLLSRGRARHALFRRDGARRTVGGCFFALCATGAKKPKAPPPSDAAQNPPATLCAASPEPLAPTPPTPPRTPPRGGQAVARPRPKDEPIVEYRRRSTPDPSRPAARDSAPPPRRVDREVRDEFRAASGRP